MLEKISRVLLALGFLGLTACIGTETRESEPQSVTIEPQVEVAPEPSLPPDDLPPSERVRKAIQLLQKGDMEAARNQLDWALQDKPSLQIAKKLRAQLDADPIETLGRKYFMYRVQPGDSLSIIAKRYLDDPLKFVILARYNGIEQPNLLQTGQRIKVPGSRKSAPPPAPKPRVGETQDATKPTGVPVVSPTEVEKPASPPVPASAAQAEQTALTTPAQASVETQPQDRSTAAMPTPPDTIDSEEIRQAAKQRSAAGDLSGAIDLLEEANANDPQDVAIQGQLITAYNEYADTLIKQGDLSTARAMLEKAVVLDSSNEAVINQLILVEDSIEARRLYAEATAFQQAGRHEEAYEMFSQVLTYTPDDRKAKQALVDSRNTLTESYHRQAMTLFRQHALDEAIAYWDKILEIDPHHALAPGYRARAVELKQQLERIE
jgi:tetratricopeptide (TPR) repeat protein